MRRNVTENMQKEVSKKPAASPKKMGPTTVRFTPEEHEELRAFADSLEVTISDLVRFRNAYAREHLQPTIADVVKIGRNTLRMP